jgi:macrocin-O-methyltransferase TylF-like protien
MTSGNQRGVSGTRPSTAYVAPRHVRMLKPVVSGFRHILPHTLFRVVYGRMFSVYRLILALVYGRRLVPAWISKDEERQLRTKSILDVMPYSLVGVGGLEATYDAALGLEQSQVPGAFIECGVARGGSAALMARVAQRCGNRRDVWLFDSYEGLPEPSSEDFADGVTGEHTQEMPAGSCLGTKEEVSWLLFEKFRLDTGRVRMVKGWFEDTLHTHTVEIPEVALLRVDADWYDSVRLCMEIFFDRVSPGGAVIIDDYETCFGAKRAVDEFLDSRGVVAELLRDGRGGVTFFR